MKKEELKSAQAELGLTNQALADLLRVSLRAVETWRQGTRPVPGPVAAYLDHLVRRNKAKQSETKRNKAKRSEIA